MAHKHSVYDTDNHFMIDGVTRAVKNASQTKTMVVQGDHNSERFTFEIPRYVDAHDMSVCNAVQVHYINIDSKDSTKFAEGVYSVDNLQVSPDDEDVVICSWLISGNATKYVGKLEFGIRFSCVSDDGKIDYVWNTAKHSNVYVTEGIYNGDVIAEEYVDILAQHEARIKALEQGGGERWEVLYVGNATTATMDFDEWPFPSGGMENSYGSALETIVPGDIVRLTVGTDSWVLPIYDGWPSKDGIAMEGLWGNSELCGNLPEVTMYTNYDYCFHPYCGYFYSRYEGTYSIKVERLVT